MNRFEASKVDETIEVFDLDQVGELDLLTDISQLQKDAKQTIKGILKAQVKFENMA